MAYFEPAALRPLYEANDWDLDEWDGHHHPVLLAEMARRVIAKKWHMGPEPDPTKAKTVTKYRSK